jgi:hypothetical protein
VCRAFAYGCIGLAASAASSLCYRAWQYFGGEDSEQPVLEELRSLGGRLVSWCCKVARFVEVVSGVVYLEWVLPQLADNVEK